MTRPLKPLTLTEALKVLGKVRPGIEPRNASQQTAKLVAVVLAATNTQE